MKENLRRAVSGIPEFEERKVYVDGAEQENFKAIVEKGREQAVAVVKKKYRLVQIRDAFGKVLDALPEDVTGSVHYWLGRGMLICFPAGTPLGLRVMNSVDASTALKVEFVAKTGQGIVYLPRQINGESVGVRVIHVGQAERKFGFALDALARVEPLWKSIVERIAAREATEEDVRILGNRMGKRTKKRLESFYLQRTLDGRRPSLWDLFEALIGIAGSRRYKSEIHRQEKLRKISAKFLSYALG